MLQTINNKIQRGFDRSAKSYDRSAGLHREIADKLLAQVSDGPVPSALLDVGCGTGYLTIKAKECFPRSNIIGLDLSQEMLSIARQKNEYITWVWADGNSLPFSDGSFNTVISNLAYQWASGLLQAFTEARRVLAPKGILACTLFGHRTCQELFRSLDAARPGALQFFRLPDETKVKEALLISGFEGARIDRQEIKVRFKDMYELLTWLRSIGANNLAHEGYIGRQTMARAAAVFRQQFSCNNGIRATFEVVRVYAKK